METLDTPLAHTGTAPMGGSFGILSHFSQPFEDDNIYYWEWLTELKGLKEQFSRSHIRHDNKYTLRQLALRGELQRFVPYDYYTIVDIAFTIKRFAFLSDTMMKSEGQYVDRLTIWSSFPIAITYLRNLESLTLRGHWFGTIPSEIKNLRKLKLLDLSGNHLISLPHEISLLKNLEELNLSGNQLTSLPPELAQLPNLRVLNISDNPITSLPPELENNPNLLIIDYGR